MSSQHTPYHIFTYLNTALLIGCFGFLVQRDCGEGNKVVSERQEDKITQEPTITPPKTTPPSNRAPQGVQEFLEDIALPLKRAAKDHQEDVGTFLPTEAEMEAAIASDSMESKEALLVLEILKKGYARYNMPFPSIQISKKPQGGAPPPPKRGGKDSKSVESWLEPTIKRLNEEAELKNIPVQGLLPTKEQREAAIKSGTFDSEAFLEVRDILEKGYTDLQLNFPDPNDKEGLQKPPEGGFEQREAPQEPKSSGSAEQQIITAYFQGQLQRIKLESQKKDVDVTSCIPSQEIIDEAVRSQEIASPKSKVVLDKIETCYELLGLPFYSPIRK